MHVLGRDAEKGIRSVPGKTIIDDLFEGVEIHPVTSGGFSGARIWRVVGIDGRQWCLRQWPASGPTKNDLFRIHAGVRAAASRGSDFLSVAIPARPFDQTAIEFAGHLWELSVWLDGEPVLLTGFNGDLLRKAVNAAAGVHQAFYDASRSLPGSGPISASSPAVARRMLQLPGAESVLGQIETVMSSQQPELDSGLVTNSVRAIRSMLPQLNALGERAGLQRSLLQPVLGDLWCENVLFQDGMVSGIIDYGSYGLDFPELPFARLVGSVVNNDEPGTAAVDWERDPTRDWKSQFLSLAGDSWAGRALNQEILGFFHQTNIILGCLNWLEWIFVQHRPFADSARAMRRAEQMMRAAVRMEAER